MTNLIILPLVFILLFSFNSVYAINGAPKFSDVTPSVGIDLSQPKLKKYGGPGVADLDRDGYQDLIFVHHDQAFEEVYFNNRDGTFSKVNFGIRDDSHGANAVPISPNTRAMRFSISVGGNFGKNPKPPVVFQVNPFNRQMTKVTQQIGLNKGGGRGRTTVHLDLSNGLHPQWPDVLVISAKALSGPSQFAYENVNGNFFEQRGIGSYAFTDNGQAMLTDVDNDGKMEVLAFWRLEMWKVTGYFKLTDISNSVFPAGLNRLGCFAVAELDYDNDGDFDLYIARTRIGPWLPDVPYDDYLLENVGGKYIDVSAKAGIPKGTESRGVTVGDFNNDGWIDIHVTQYNAPDLLLINQGKSFKTVSGLTPRAANVRGDNAQAVDYDLDGRLDIISSQGDQIDPALGGSFRVFKNTFSLGANSNYINVRVANPFDRSCTPISAVILVNAGNLWMKRRVGGPGTQVTNSYIETQHFGLGSFGMAKVIYVRYTNGYVVVLQNVKAGQTVTAGVL